MIMILCNKASLVVVLGALTTNTNTAIQSGLAQVQGSICPASEVCLYGHRIPCALGDQEVVLDCGRHMNEAQPYIYQQVMRARLSFDIETKANVDSGRGALAVFLRRHKHKNERLAFINSPQTGSTKLIPYSIKNVSVKATTLVVLRTTRSTMDNLEVMKQIARIIERVYSD